MPQQPELPESNQLMWPPPKPDSYPTWADETLGKHTARTASTGVRDDEEGRLDVKLRVCEGVGRLAELAAVPTECKEDLWHRRVVPEWT